MKPAPPHRPPPIHGPSPTNRLPPGQRQVERLPVLHVGSPPRLDPSAWTLRLFGSVTHEVTLSWADLQALPAAEVTCDLHCVTGWTLLDSRWRGVRVRDLLGPDLLTTTARHVLVHADKGWTTNLPVAELLREEVLLAYELEGRPLPPEHGGPVRLLVPRLYFWKSAKWVTGFEFTAEERLGYWETRGYHALGDPWLEQRYA